MAICVDPKLTYLNGLGYSVLRFPRQGIAPLGIIGVDGKKRDLLGTLDQVWASALPVPAPGPQLAAGNISGFQTSDLKVSAGLDILANALKAMFGGTAPSLDATYGDAKTMQFQLGDVTVSGIDDFVIGDYITKGELATDNPFVRRYFTGQDGTQTFVISKVLLAKSISVTAKKNDNTAVTVNVPAIQAAVGAKISVSTSSGSGTEVTYANAIPLVFGFQMFEIIYAGKRWDVKGVAPSAGTSFSDEDSPAAPDSPIVVDGELVEIDYSKSFAQGA